MARRKADPQSTLFNDAVNIGESAGPSFLPASTEATVVPDLALRKQDGDLRNIRHPVEMSAIEPKTRKLTYLSHKLWMFLVSYSLQTQATRTDLGLLWRIPLSTLQKDIEYRSNDSEHLKESIRQCQKTLVEWASSARDRETGEVRAWTSTQLLGSVEFVIDNRGIRCLEWTFPPALLRQMQEHKHWFESSLAIANQLTRHSSLALFRVVSRYKTSPSGLTERRAWRDWIPILTGESNEAAELTARLRSRKTGDGSGAKVEKYKEWRYFNRDVIAPAVKELNAVLDDIWVEAKPIKVGGSVDSLQFKVTQRSDFRRIDDPVDTVEAGKTTSADALVGLGLTRKLATELCREHGEELMNEAVGRVKTRLADARLAPVRNVQGLLITVKDELVAERTSRVSAAVAEQGPRRLSADVMATESLEDYRNDLANLARRDWPSLPPEVQDDYLARFKQDGIPVNLKVAHSHFEKSGIKQPMVRAMFFRWLACERAGEAWTPSDRELLAFERSRRAR
ncbi:replication initiation protein [Derxia gummosa]|uniref:Replication initiation protein n=1 Tax=Derxia gummosa DSM 723 TaxID=1121388 RepID=A0A8B6X4H9_9BURK|nr:replication initiation protein [Derxia gummosa]